MRLVLPFACFRYLFHPQPAATGSAEAVAGMSTCATFVAVGLAVSFDHFFYLMPAAFARLTFTGLRGSPVREEGNANERQPKPTDDPR